mmetsp:Transcript_30650/g.56008  ORF Transcript_30650/g.56008 Transcript_30650/m.56008 type:complete len:218 (-) Transcript_30650:58-711(-)
MRMEADLPAQLAAKADAVERLKGQREALQKAVRKAESQQVLSVELATVLARADASSAPAVVPSPSEPSPNLAELQERKRLLQERIADAKAALEKAHLLKTPERKRPQPRVAPPSCSRKAEFMTVRKAEQSAQMLASLHKEIQRRELQKGWEDVAAIAAVPRQKTHRDKEGAAAPKSLLGQTLDKIAAEHAEVEALASNLDLQCQAFSYRFQTIRDMK